MILRSTARSGRECLVVLMLSWAALSAQADDFPTDHAGERAAAWEYREATLERIRAEHADSSPEDRARALVEAMFALESGSAAQPGLRLSALPEGARLAGIEFPSMPRGRADREIRVLLDFPEEFLGSDKFNEYEVSKIGHGIFRTLLDEPFNRFFLYARDPASGEVVDIQDLLPKEEAPLFEREVDHASVVMAQTQGKNAARDLATIHEAIVPTINPGQPRGALSGKTIFINQSHGWFDDFEGLGRWRVQRGANHGILEDFDSAEFISLYVLPALRNAGAKVQTVRESDHQTNMVIVDNSDGTSNPSRGSYVETGTWTNSSINGFVHKSGASWNGVSVNPFNQGSGQNRLVSGGLTTGEPTATATWTANIPATGYYNVYASWTAFSARATDAQYLIYHSGGVSEVRMDQTIDGYTWNLLGNWHFEAGAPPDERKVVLTNHSNDSGATNVSADAVRWGGGMGDFARHTNGVSGRPRWEEEAVIYLQFNGFGYSGTAYTGNDDESGGWSDRPQYARWEHSQKDGSVEDAIYFAWHTNAFNGSARGLSSFRHSTATAASATLQTIMHDTLYDHIEELWFPGWTVRSKNVTNFGENNQTSLGTGLPGFLLEGLFHDNVTDATAYGDPRFRADYARAMVHAVINYFENRDGVTLANPPETPTHFRAESLGQGRARLSWSPPPNRTNHRLFGDAATSYRVYRSPNGFGFDDGTPVAGTSLEISVRIGEPAYFRVAAVNAGGQSFPSETLAASDGNAKVLIVQGFDRNERSLVPTINVTNAGSNLRVVDPRFFQAFNYVLEHADSLAPIGLRISSTSNEALVRGDLSLSDYDAVFWICGEESTTDETFSAAEQGLVSSYLNTPGKNLFVSGAEIAWDLDNQGSAQDKAFFLSRLKATYAGDDSNTYNVSAPGSGPFAGLSAFNFNPSLGARYDAEFPDQLTPQGGAQAALSYSGGSGGTAAVSFAGSSRLVYLGFPFETISTRSARDAVMRATVKFFGLELRGVFKMAEVLADSPSQPRVAWN